MDVLLEGALLEQLGEGVRGLDEVLVVRVGAHHDAARVQVVVQGLGFAQELRAEDDVLGAGLLADGLRVANRNRGLDDHNRVRVDLHDQIDDGLHGGGVEEVLLAVVVGRGGDDHEVSVRVGLLAVERGGEVQFLLGEVLLDVVVLNRGLTGVDHVDLRRDDVHGGDLMVLRQQRGQTQSHIAGAGHGDLQRIEILHVLLLSICSTVIFKLSQSRRWGGGVFSVRPRRCRKPCTTRRTCADLHAAGWTACSRNRVPAPPCPRR